MKYCFRYVYISALLLPVFVTASTILQVHDRPESDHEQGGILATPQEQRGPQLDLDRDNNPIITFKAARKDCQAYALIPSKAAVDDRLSIHVVYNNRLPNNQKWKKDTKISHTFMFDKPLEIYYDDAGTTALHGGAAYQDTNHNWGIRLLKNGTLLEKESDYLKYIRHGYSTTVPYDISRLTLDEAEYLRNSEALSLSFESTILKPLKDRAHDSESWSGSHEGFRLIMIDTINGKKPGIDGSLDKYLTGKSDCSKKEMVLRDGWVFIRLKK